MAVKYSGICFKTLAPGAKLLNLIAYGVSDEERSFIELTLM
jgi:hypothetical protein